MKVPVLALPIAIVASSLLTCAVIYTVAPAPKPAKSPVLFDDVRAVVTALQPFEKKGYDRVSVCVRSERQETWLPAATVGIKFHPKPDTEISGWGDDLQSAIADLMGSAYVAQSALSPLVKMNK